MHMSQTDELLRSASRYAVDFDSGALPMPPALGVAVVACMDARLNPFGLLGLREGDAHVIRNAGGVVTDDVIRSLAISQRLLGTTEIMLIHHTDCGMLTFTDDDFLGAIEADTGTRPTWAPRSFTDVATDMRDSIIRVAHSPFIPVKRSIRGFIYDVAAGTVSEVT
jgi:carbonic anhydrase